MTPIQTLEKSDLIQFPPSEIYSDEPPVETDLHLRQIFLLLSCLEWYWRAKNDFFASGNITIYYSPHQKKSEYFRGPDFFVVKDTQRKTRKSWVVWEENGKYPNVIVEILSDSTAKTDREEKKQIYQDTFRTPNYFWFEPNTLEFAGFTLIKGKYKPIKPTKKGWFYSDELELYLGIHNQKLRYFTPDGELVPTPEEAALKERLEKELAIQQAESERLQKELAIQQAESERLQKDLANTKILQLEQKLRDLGVNPDSI